MIVRCWCKDCKHWSKEGGAFINEGGCTLDMVSITDDSRAPGWFPTCNDYEENPDYKEEDE